MTYSDERLFECIIEIDTIATGVSNIEADFIESVIDRQQRKFSPKQRAWIEGHPEISTIGDTMGLEDWQQVVKPEDMAYHALDYIQHTQWVTQGLLLMQVLLSQRILTHDRSKIVDGMERNVYASVVPEFADKIFGTDEHEAVGKKLGPAWQHHLEHNRHHPEHFENGIEGMTLIDLIEMLCDWKAAGLREEKGSLYRSIEILKDRHNIGPQLEAVLINTASLLQGVKKYPNFSQKQELTTWNRVMR